MFEKSIKKALTLAHQHAPHRKQEIMANPRGFLLSLIDDVYRALDIGKDPDALEVAYLAHKANVPVYAVVARLVTASKQDSDALVKAYLDRLFQAPAATV